MLKHVNNSVGAVTLNLAVKLVFSIVAACPPWRSDSGCLVVFQPSYITEAVKPKSKELKPSSLILPILFWGRGLQACTFKPYNKIANSCMHLLSWPVGHWNNSFSSLTQNTFLCRLCPFYRRRSSPWDDTKPSLHQRGLRAHTPAHWPVLVLPGTSSCSIYKRSEIRKNK